MRLIRILTAIAVLLPTFASTADAQIDARMLRNPAVSDTRIAFVYGGDIWIVSKEGGVAMRLSSPEGEESMPRFSPDGRWLAFSGNYHGNTDIYVIPVTGGLPERLTHHPMDDRVLGWYPDGSAILMASPRHSGRQRFSQLYRLARNGGMPEAIPLEYGEFASLSPDGKQLAFTIKSRAFRTWKRYRGGMAADLSIYDFASGEVKAIAPDVANDEMPMWHGRKIYFLSDRGPERRFNVWSYDLDSSALKQLTRFTEADVHFPSIGPSDIVFAAAGDLHLMDLSTERVSAVEVRVVTDRATLQPTVRKVGDLVRSASISPSGRRVAVEARGEVFTLPAEHGPILNLTGTSGFAERHPVWSPDGKWMAYFTDRTGEYELAVRPAEEAGEEKILTSMGPGFRYAPAWSPDSSKLAFIDHTQTLQVFDRQANRLSKIDQQKWQNHDGLEEFDVAWSPDSRWLAFPRDQERLTTAIALYDSRNGQTRQVTSGFYNDRDPAFDPDGKYLYYVSSRSLAPVYSDVDTTWIYPNTGTLVAVPLRADVPSPLAPRNDSERVAATPEKEEETDDEKKKRLDTVKPPTPVAIDLDGFELRAVILPPKGANYDELSAAAGKLLYLRRPAAGAPEDAPSSLHYWDLEEREENTILAEVDAYELSAKGEKILALREKNLSIVKLEPDQKLEETLALASLETTVDPAAEWRQIFNDAWRFERDYFYDPNMHGLDWNAIRTQYGALIDQANTRSDVNYILGEMIAELDASHTYRGGGDQPSPTRRSGGLLGADWKLEGGSWRVAKIIEGAPWDAEVRSPLARAGVKVGEWVVAANGRPIDPSRDIWVAFEGLADSAVLLSVNSRPSLEGAREVVIETLTPDEDVRLRHLAWIDQNRRTVERISGGRIGYIYVPDTGREGQTELVRQFLGQYDKDGLIIDERFNSGGQIPDRFIELLNRPTVAFWARRHGKDWQWPLISHTGPKAMLINGWSGSGGDAFPAYFKQAGLGPLIGTRTWGGLIGLSGNPELIDGGAVTVPTFRMYLPDGTWFREGHGVDPDIEVPEDPAAVWRGEDPQLLRAVAEVQRLIDARNPRTTRPTYENRSGRN